MVRHLHDDEEERLIKSLMIDVYDGMKPTYQQMVEKHCPFCASSAVGNGLMQAAVWYMCLPYIAKIAEIKGRARDDEYLKQQQEELHSKLTEGIAKTLRPVFAHLGQWIQENHDAS